MGRLINYILAFSSLIETHQFCWVPPNPIIHQPSTNVPTQF
uniref:Uncharacterized protein n=1 Tax=Rhizophora mucronata TaxID=61149 RepID=A0A2P2R5F4_RHIMU